MHNFVIEICTWVCISATKWCKILHFVRSKISMTLLNTSSPRQNGHRFADDTFKRIFWNENVRILIKISLKFVPQGPINNIPALVKIMDWCRSGDKPLSEPMMIILLTHICVTRPRWVKDANPRTLPYQSVTNTERVYNTWRQYDLGRYLPVHTIGCPTPGRYGQSVPICYPQYYRRWLILDMNVSLFFWFVN